MKPMTIALIVFGILWVVGGVLGALLISAEQKPLEEVQKMEPTQSKIVATRDLPAFTLIKESDLQSVAGSDDSKGPETSNFLNRYLLTSINQKGEVKDTDLAPVGATEVLNDAIAVSIAPSAATSLGGQLHAGDVVELLAVQPPKPPIKLVVLNPGSKDATPAGTITLAVASNQREQFAAAIGATTLALTRRIDVHK